MNMEITFAGGRKVDVSFKGFAHKTDQPPDHGGDGSAPEPLDLFFASIGACTASAILGFCRSREIDTDEIRVTASFTTDESGERVEKISHQVHLPETFPAKYVKAIARIAGTCSVKRYLADPPEIETVAVLGEA